MRGTEFAQGWRQVVVSSYQWEVNASYSCNPGEAGGFWVSCSDTQHTGWLKPCKDEPNVPRAAREKIAADLAHEADISVPPVVLYRRPNPPAGQTAQVSISALCYSKQFEFGQLQAAISTDPTLRSVVESSLAVSSAIVAFDAWVANTDRGNDRNAVYGFDAIDAAFKGSCLYFDFSYSMGWASSSLTAFTTISVPGVLQTALSGVEIEAGIQRIQAIDDSVIEQVVSRMPEDFIDCASKAVIIEGLIARKSILGHQAAAWCPVKL